MITGISWALESPVTTRGIVPLASAPSGCASVTFRVHCLRPRRRQRVGSDEEPNAATIWIR